MNDDEFFEALRGDARSLRYEGTAASHERIRAGVQSRIAREEGIAVILLGWFRPVAIGLAAVVSPMYISRMRPAASTR